MINLSIPTWVIPIILMIIGVCYGSYLLNKTNDWDFTTPFVSFAIIAISIIGCICYFLGKLF